MFTQIIMKKDEAREKIKLLIYIKLAASVDACSINNYMWQASTLATNLTKKNHKQIKNYNKIINTENIYNLCYKLEIMLKDWKFYLLNNFRKLQKIGDFGALYEQFISEFPEFRKQWGVYYTPQYIVEYIVENTVGKLIEGKTPEEISEIKILDPSCGSGSFLLGAYEYLLNYHLKYYHQLGIRNYELGIFKNKKNSIHNSQFIIPNLLLTPEGNLTNKEKKRILLNNIYGVDIDPQAVEVAKLSLLLKALEGETETSIETSLKIFNERVLPTLDNNIRCGNSLIAPDFYDDGLFLTPKEERKINVFDWNLAFAKILENGGFDCIIGNPPYGAFYGKFIKHYLSEFYKLPIPICDTYLLFILKALKLLKNNSILSMIVPSTWLYMSQFEKFRKNIIENYTINEIQLFKKPVFEQATVETCIILLKNQKSETNSIYKFIENIEVPHLFKTKISECLQNDIIEINNSNLIINKNNSVLYTKILLNKPKLKDIALIVCGLTPYRIGKGKPNQTKEIITKRTFDADYKKDESYRKYLMGRDFHKYRWQLEKQRWISYGDWLAEPRQKAPFNDEKKIVIRQTADTIIAHLDTQQFLSLKNVHNLRITANEINYEYLLGLLNSKLISWWYQQLIPEKGRTFAEVKVVNLNKLPIKTIDFNNKTEKQQHDKLVKFVESMLELNNRFQNTNLQTDKDQLKHRIEHIDNEINKLVYQLYQITEQSDIDLIEGKI